MLWGTLVHQLNIVYMKRGKVSNMNLGKLLQKERNKQGLSQQKLADMAGVTKRAICYWENGTKKMSIDSADKVFCFICFCIF